MNACITRRRRHYGVCDHLHVAEGLSVKMCAFPTEMQADDYYRPCRYFKTATGYLFICYYFVYLRVFLYLVDWRRRRQYR